MSLRGDRVHKPRSIVWEQLVLGVGSPLRRVLDEAAARDPLGSGAFDFLPRLAFFPAPSEPGGEVERVILAPLPERPTDPEALALAAIVGRFVALFTWLGVADLHWENLVLGRDAAGRTVFAPLDVEMILADMALPTETKLVPDADPEVVAICRHAAGLRRILPYLGKPVTAPLLLTLVRAYLDTLAFLDRHAPAIAAVFTGLPDLGESPIRVCLRGTGDYVRARTGALWPPLLQGESVQLARGDIPYFFRLVGKPGIHFYADRELRRLERLPMRGDVPQLEPLLPLSPPARALRAASRKSLREEGLFTLLGAFDHPALTGTQTADGLSVTFQRRTLVVRLPSGDELVSRRNMGAFVASLYLPCTCGEVRTPFVPSVTTCETAPRP